MKNLITGFIVALNILFVANVGNAHSFKVMLIVPSSGEDAKQGRQVRDGFLRAAREKDGHSNEESDGHLGGLDVYLVRVDGAGDARKVVTRVKSMLRGEKFEFITSVAFTGLAEIRTAVSGSATLFVDPPNNIGSLLDPTGSPIVTDSEMETFSTMFEGEYGYKPSRAAQLGYGIARLIDSVIRRHGEDLSDIASLRRTLESFRRR